MTLDVYQQEVKRTLPDLGSETLNIAHMLFGMNSEFNELYEAVDDVNRAEELTDINWYATNYCNIKNIDSWRVFEFSEGYYKVLENSDYIEQLQVSISKLTDLEKKVLAYKKETARDVFINGIVEVYERLNDCYVYYGIDPYDSMQKNIDKLRARYADKFSEDAANNRDLQKERKILEGEDTEFVDRVLLQIKEDKN